MNTGISKFLLFTLLLLMGCNTHAETLRILVFYPLAQKTLETVYTSTLKGINNKVDHSTFIALPETADLTDVQIELDRYVPDHVIALGNKAVDLLNKSSYRAQALAGLMYFNPTEYHGVSLALDSRVLVSHLQRLTPRIKRVFIVQNNDRRVIQHDPSTGLSKPLLIIREGVDLLATMRILGQLLELEASANDAIVLPAYIPKDILYEVSRMAWTKNIMLLSTNLAHLEYGAMLVFYPNMVALGEQLGAMAKHKTASYEAVKSVDISLNQRVAQHLGHNFKPASLRLFSVILK